MRNSDYDVVISGYGPTGQALASILARLGHSVCVFERWPDLYGLPRLCTLDGESARIIQAAGDIDHALRDSNPCRRYYLLNSDGEVLIDIDWTADHVAGFPLRISMHQPDIEDAMDQAARARGAEVNQGWEVVGVEQDEAGATVRARSTTGNSDMRSVRARYVVGADGARSVVRTALSIEREDYPFRNAWLSLDVVRKRTLPTYYGLSEDLRVPFVVCAPEGATRAAVPIGYTRIRFEFLVDPDSDHTERLDPAIGYEYLRKYYDLTAEDVELYRSVIYPFAGAVANRWRAGRVFLAGDAAHLMTPFLGQGACSGLRDSINLAWKLDLVLRGVAGEELLDSYEQERRPHVSAVVAGSDALGAMACEPDVEAARARDEFFLSGNVPEIPGDPVLTAGVVDVADGSMPSPPIGDMAPQGIVARQGRTGRFDDVLGWGFQLVLADADPRPLLSSAQRSFLDEIGCVATGVGEHESEGVVADVDGAYRRFFDEHGIVGFLMRPDFSVFGVLHEAAQIPVLVEVLRGRLTAPAWIGTRKGASA